MPRKLKVYQTALGFYDSIVAAPSQAAALRAWGTDTNLFRDGYASEATDREAIAAALEHPETPLRRPVGSKDQFSLKPKLPRVSEIEPVGKHHRHSKPEPPRSKPAPPLPPPPDRSKLDAAEAALKRLTESQGREEAVFARQRQRLDDQEARAREKWGRDQAQAERNVERERRAYQKAGGKT